MRPLFAFSLLLASCPLAAQPFEVGLMLGTQQNGSLYSYSRGGGGRDALEPNSLRLVRFAYRVADFGPVGAQFSLGYQPENEAQRSPSAYGRGPFKQRMVSMGFGFSSNTPWLIGGHMEYRRENLEQEQESTTYTRAWVRFNLGYNFTTSPGKPFIGIELNFPLENPDSESLYRPTTEASLKALAARRQSGIYVGVRF